MSQQCWEASRWFFCCTYYGKLAGPRKILDLNLLPWTQGPTTLVGILSSSFTRLQCLNALLFSKAFGSRKACRRPIQFVPSMVSHPHKNILCPLTGWLLSCWVRFVPHMNRESSLDTYPATSLLGAWSSAATNQWDLTVEHVFHSLFDELKRSVDESMALGWCKANYFLAESQPRWFWRIKKYSPSPCIYSPCLHTLPTISRTFDKPSLPLLPHCTTLDHIFKTPDACLEEPAFHIHHFLFHHRWETEM